MRNDTKKHSLFAVLFVFMVAFSLLCIIGADIITGKDFVLTLKFVFVVMFVVLSVYTIVLQIKMRIKGFTMDANDCPDLVPICAVLGAMASGKTVINNYRWK